MRCADCGRKRRGEDWGSGSGDPLCIECHVDAFQEFKDRNARVGVETMPGIGGGEVLLTVSAPPKYVLTVAEWAEFGYRPPRQHRRSE